MRKALPLALACAFGALGCAHQAIAPSQGGIIGGTEDTFESAYQAVRSGEKATARAGGWIIDRVGDGTIRVMRESGLDKTANAISDEWIRSKIAGRFALDPDVKARDIKVDSDAGVVTLRGQVASEQEAIKAIQDALDLNGVLAVNSELQYPMSQANVREYHP